MRSAMLAVAAFLLCPLGAVSSQIVQPTNGDRIRLTATPYGLKNRTARVVNLRSDSLFLQVAPAETLAVALAGVTRLEVSTGRRSLARRGAGIGALVGMGSGAFMGLASGDDKRGMCCFFLTAEEKALAYGVGLGVTGLVIGTIVGGFQTSDRWTSVPLGAAVATPSLQMGRGGARLGMALSY